MSEIIENDIDGEYAIKMLRKISANADLREITLIAENDEQKYSLLTAHQDEIEQSRPLTVFVHFILLQIFGSSLGDDVIEQLFPSAAGTKFQRRQQR